MYSSFRIAPTTDFAPKELARHWNGFVVYLEHGAKWGHAKQASVCPGCGEKSAGSEVMAEPCTTS